MSSFPMGGDNINKRQKEVLEYQLEKEKEVIQELKKQYSRALKDIQEKIKLFQADIDLLDQALSQDGLDDATKALLQSQKRSKVYQQQYQRALSGQVSGILDKMHGDSYASIDKYLNGCYETGYIGTMYDIAGQGIPLIVPIDQAAIVKAVLTDSKVSNGLYAALGVDVAKLKKTITQEISRGIASGLSYADIARNLKNAVNVPLYNSERIVRTESHRIQQQSTEAARKAAANRGADVVRQWDSALDGRTRDSHRRVDGEIREIDEKFSNGLLYPGDPSGRAAEVINCRCVALTRARWGLDEDELETLKERAEYFGLDKTDSFEEYKKKYLKAEESIKQSTVHGVKNKYGEEIQFHLDGMSTEQQEAVRRKIEELSAEYDTSLREVFFNPKLGAINGKETGSVDGFYGYVMEIKNASIVEHEFFHTLTYSGRKNLAKKYGLALEVNEDFQKEADRLFREYKKAAAHDKALRISDYSLTDVDEFLAEVFNVSHGGVPADAWGVGAKSPFAARAAEIIDKYFKNPLAKSANSSTMKLGNTEVRKWYIDRVSKITDGIDKTLPIEEQARQAFEARNRIRTEARNMMADEATRKKLEVERPNKTFEELIESKMKRKGMTREEAIEDIYKTATRTNVDVNRELGLDGD